MIETLIWVGVVLVIGLFAWMTEPHHTRMIDAVHGRAEAKKAKRKILLGSRELPEDHVA
jgi:hypothetical protein